MTLIAAHKVEEIPLLIGDFLITGGNRSFTLKKVHIISPNLAVGWTGNLLAARPVLRALNAQFKHARVSRKELERFLTSYSQDESTEVFVRLIGWIVDEEPRCFRWRSDYTSEVFYADHFFDGSGADTYEALVNNPGTKRGVQSRSISNVEKAIYFALFQACTLMSDEVMDKKNQQIGFGHGYEAAYFDNNEFKFVDDVLYVVWDFYYDLKGKGGGHRFYPIVHKYRSFGYYSVVQRHNFQTAETVFNAITPIFDDMPNLFEIIPGVDVANKKALPLASNYYCLFFRLEASDGVMGTGSVVFPGTQDNLPLVIERTGGREILRFKFDFVAVLYEQLIKMQS